MFVKSRVKPIRTKHLDKLSNLRNKRSTYSKNINNTIFIQNTVSNVSNYTLAEDEYNALAFGPSYSNQNKKDIIDTEFVLYFQSINRLVN